MEQVLKKMKITRNKMRWILQIYTRHRSDACRFLLNKNVKQNLLYVSSRIIRQMRSFSSLNRNQETVANTYDCSLRIAENSSTSVSGYTITSRETRLNHFSHKPLMVTESNIAFTLLLSTVNEPDVGPLRTSTSTVATPSLLPSFTVN